MDLFGDGGTGQKGPLPIICHTYPTIMKLGTAIPYLKNIQKLYESRDTFLIFAADISTFLLEISNIKK